VPTGVVDGEELSVGLVEGGLLPSVMIAVLALPSDPVKICVRTSACLRRSGGGRLDGDRDEVGVDGKDEGETGV
jgi:hypothetical protein